MVLFQPFVNSFTELFTHLCNQSITCLRFTASDPWGENAGVLDGNSILMGGAEIGVEGRSDVSTSACFGGEGNMIHNEI